jgi:hypothetical protein
MRETSIAYVGEWLTCAPFRHSDCDKYISENAINGSVVIFIAPSFKSIFRIANNRLINHSVLVSYQPLNFCRGPEFALARQDQNPMDCTLSVHLARKDAIEKAAELTASSKTINVRR